MSRETSRDDKPYSVRLPPQQAKGLGIVARVEGVNVSEALRAAVCDYLSRRLADRGFQKRLEQEVAEERQVIESLSLRAHG
jgi:Arc/MetJ-type ribon-helix-helix transcriptional regulator